MAVSRMRKALFVVMLFLGATPSSAGLDERMRAKREVILYYGYSDSLSAHAMILSLWRYENGLKGIEAGHHNRVRDAEVAGNPCLSHEAQNYAKSARAMIRFTMEWVMKDPYLRKQWSKSFASWYHAGTKEKNEEYAKMLRTLFLDERAALKSGIYESCQSGTAFWP